MGIEGRKRKARARISQEAKPNFSDVCDAMDRAVKSVEEEFLPIFGNRAVVVVNVATKDWAFGSPIVRSRRRAAGAYRQMEHSLAQSSEEAADV